ncbi:MAG: AI-2E family transporter [Coriobacteriia bacterium]|nr:AI-2E family transporter [Coriobacteriia bacterium]
MSTPVEAEKTPADQTLRSWAFAGIVIWAVVGFGLLIRGSGQVLGDVLPALTSFFIAGLLIAIFRPITRWLKAHKVPDALAALGGVLSAIVVMVLLVALFLVPVVSGAAGFFTSIPATVTTITNNVQSGVSNYQKLPNSVKNIIESMLTTLSSHASDAASNGVGMLVAGVSTIFSLGLEMFLGLILMFWFLKDGPRIAKAMLNVVPKRWHDDVAVIASSFDSSFSGYLVATAINCSVIFVLDGIGFTVIKLPNAWFIAAMVAILGIIPYLGSILSFLLAFVVGLLAGPAIGIETGVIVFMVDQIVYSFIGPIVAGKTVTLHPVMIIFALSVGAALAGILGAVLSIPIAAAIRVIFIYYRDRHAAGVYSGNPPSSVAEEA